LQGLSTGRRWHTTILSEVQIQNPIIPSPSKHQDRKRQEWDRENIQNTPEDETLCNTNFIATVIKSIRDRIEGPDKNKPASDAEVGFGDGETSGGGEACL